MSPIDHPYPAMPKRRRFLPWLLAGALALGAGALPTLTPSVAAGNGCSRHQSEARPPDSIRVLNANTGRVSRVNFKTYVARVASSEWGSTPTQLRIAGVIAVKQYGWNKSMHPRMYNGRCFDVWNNTRDQIYRVKTPRPEVVAAMNASWGTTVRRADGTLIHTGYRSGAAVGCARDAGKRLYARSATKCANAGWSAARILTVYYADRGARVHF